METAGIATIPLGVGYLDGNGREKDGPGSQPAVTAQATSQPRRKRGRQKNTANPETAAERRRTQIRLAQRAYRARQEATLSQLKAQIGQLEDAVENLSQIFLRFSDTLMQSGVLKTFPEVTHSLQEATKSFVLLANKATEPPEMETSRETFDKPENSGPELRSTLLGSVSTACTNSIPRDTIGMEAMGALNVDSSPSRLTSEPNDASVLFPAGFDELPTHPPTPVEAPTPPAEIPYIRSPSLYGPRSPFFSERLHWVCVQRALHYLKDFTVPDSKFSYTFGFLMTMMSREQLIGYFSTLVDRSGSPDVFEEWSIPTFSLGGAGSHYPRKLLPATSPIQLKTYLNQARCEDNDEVWFDTEDVEGFLEANGVILWNRNSSEQVTALGASQTPHQNMLSADLQSPTLIVDEHKLARWLSRNAVCLGRVVGFRRRDVESFILKFAWPLC
ncbi:hypothetical protein P175DRAFT_0444124 [Aspergillus ochraceoroseus IBT 24754]|nr:uncharacterized protein P175DRAFT_0444124 [Aspergillus ochraceoroseus IBT 24754]PTU17974.1 hypothetical protein P175DRAFT_0444124 [Aspergillus ochraceoroseus IBT 24754]